MSFETHAGAVAEIPHNFFELGLACSIGREGRIDLIEAA